MLSKYGIEEESLVPWTRRSNQSILIPWIFIGRTDTDALGTRCEEPTRHEFEQTPRDSDGQGSLSCCSSGGHKESDMTELLNNEQQFLYIRQIRKTPTLKQRGVADTQSHHKPYNWFGNL